MSPLFYIYIIIRFPGLLSPRRIVKDPPHLFFLLPFVVGSLLLAVPVPVFELAVLFVRIAAVCGLVIAVAMVLVAVGGTGLGAGVVLFVVIIAVVVSDVTRVVVAVASAVLVVDLTVVLSGVVGVVLSVVGIVLSVIVMKGVQSMQDTSVLEYGLVHLVKFPL